MNPHAFRSTAAMSATTTVAEPWIATLAHELREPLNSVALSLGALELTCAADPDARPAFAAAQRGTQQMARLIEDILDLSAHDRLGEGVFILTMHPQCIGRGHRLLMLERLITHMRNRSGVTFKTMSEVALEFKKMNPLKTIG